MNTSKIKYNYKKSKLVHGVGINDADYPVQVRKTISDSDGGLKRVLVSWCPYYRVWANLIGRAYSDKVKKLQPTYADVTVSNEWLRFSNFKAWMETQPWRGNHLDKDILVVGNKHYSSETCVFVPRSLNNFIYERVDNSRDLPSGVWRKTNSEIFISECANPFTGRREYLGSFKEPEEAHLCWLRKKLYFAKMLTEGLDDVRISKAIVQRYESQIKELLK